MARIKGTVTLSIDRDLNDRWTKVTKKLNMTKSGMVSEYLEKVIPILEKEKPNDILGAAFKELGNSMNETASLFE